MNGKIAPIPNGEVYFPFGMFLISKVPFSRVGLPMVVFEKNTFANGTGSPFFPSVTFPRTAL